MSSPASNRLCFGQYVLEPLTGRLRVVDTVVELRPRAFEVLLHLARHAGHLVTKEALIAAAWPNVVVTDDSLVQCIGEIRRALGDEEQQVIRTVPRRGYVLTLPVVESDSIATEPAQYQVTPRLESPGSPAAFEDGGKPRRIPRARIVIAASAIAVATAILWLVTEQLWRKPYIDNPLFTIVVLPLKHSGGAAQERFADGLTADLTLQLSRISSSFVITRNTAGRYKEKVIDPKEVGRELGVRYVLQGNIERHTVGTRLHLDLVDAETGQQLWAEKFDETSDEHMLERIVRTLHLKLLDAEAHRASRERPTTPTVDDLAIRGHALIERQTAETIEQARQLALQAVRLEPSVIYGWNTLAATYFLDLSYRWYLRYGTREEWTKRAQQAAAKAYSLDPNNFYAIGVWAWSLQMQGRFEEAVAAVERQIEMNRNYTVAFHRLAYLKMLMGLPEEALVLEQRVLRATPKNNLVHSAYGIMAMCYIHLGRDAEAVVVAQKGIETRPDLPNNHAHLAAAAANVGDMDRARSALAEFRRLTPNFTLKDFRAESLSERPAFIRHHERYYEGLRKAGLEE